MAMAPRTMSDRATTLREARDRLSELIALGLGDVPVTGLIAPQDALNQIQRAALPRKDPTDMRPSMALHYGTLGGGGLQITPAETLAEVAGELERLEKIEAAAKNGSATLDGGFIRCETCGDQESTTDVDFAAELRATLKR